MDFRWSGPEVGPALRELVKGLDRHQKFSLASLLVINAVVFPIPFVANALGHRFWAEVALIAWVGYNFIVGIPFVAFIQIDTRYRETSRRRRRK